MRTPGWSPTLRQSSLLPLLDKWALSRAGVPLLKVGTCLLWGLQLEAQLLPGGSDNGINTLVRGWYALLFLLLPKSHYEYLIRNSGSLQKSFHCRRSEVYFTRCGVCIAQVACVYCTWCAYGAVQCVQCVIYIVFSAYFPSKFSIAKDDCNDFDLFFVIIYCLFLSFGTSFDLFEPF